MSPLDAALEYASRLGPVFPVRFNPDPSARKRPLTANGMNDATREEGKIREWWRSSTNAVPAIVTGEPSGIVALDIDIRAGGSGFDSLDDLGISFHPTAPTAHTPRGGCAVLFHWPGHFVKTCAGEIGPYLDVRGDRGSLILPPGPRRFWDPHLGLDTPIPPMPAWMVVAASAVHDQPIEYRPPTPLPLSRYADAAVRSAVKAIIEAQAGQQRDTLNNEVYSIARLVAGGAIPPGFAIESLLWAATRMRSYDSRRPWRGIELEKLVRSAFADGLARPRPPGRMA